MKKLQLYIILLLWLFASCDRNHEELPKQTPSAAYLKGLWKSENNDSIKFVKPGEVYINSVLHYYSFEKDSLKLQSLCNDLYCSVKGTINYYGYGIDSAKNQLIIYDFYNTFDTIFNLNNENLSFFTKSSEPLQVQFHEWIQGTWISGDNSTLLFTCPYLLQTYELDNKYYSCAAFVEKGLLYGGNGLGSQYVFTKDKLRLHSSLSSDLCSFSSYGYVFFKDEDMLVVFNYQSTDTAKFYKNHGL